LSEELETAAKVGGGAIIGPLFVWLVKKMVGAGDAKMQHFDHSLESHREQIEILKQKVVELDTRLGIREGRYGVEPMTNPGMRPSAAIEALRAKSRSSDDE